MPDHNSTIDALVLVGQKARTHREKLGLQHAVSILKQHSIDAQVRPLDEVLAIGSTSVPYIEAWRSPFLLADEYATALLRAWVPDPWVVAVHAQRFALHVAGRGSAGQSLPKRARNVIAVRNLLETGSPLIDRTQAVPGTELTRRSARWLEDCLRITSAHHDTERIRAVINHLNGV